MQCFDIWYAFKFLDLLLRLDFLVHISFLTSPWCCFNEGCFWYERLRGVLCWWSLKCVIFTWFTVLHRIQSCHWTSASAGSRGVCQTPPLASGDLWWRSAEHPASRRDPLTSLSHYCRTTGQNLAFLRQELWKGKTNWVIEFIHKSGWLDCLMYNYFNITYWDDTYLIMRNYLF